LLVIANIVNIAADLGGMADGNDHLPYLFFWQAAQEVEQEGA